MSVAVTGFPAGIHDNLNKSGNIPARPFYYLLMELQNTARFMKKLPHKMRVHFRSNFHSLSAKHSARRAQKRRTMHQSLRFS
jgi:hypothetical protein